MKNLLLAGVLLFAATASAQHNIQFDDGAGHYSLLKGQSTNASDLFLLPSGGGTLLTSVSIGAMTWALGGNASAAPNNQLGTTDATALNFITGGVANVRMSISPVGTVSIGSTNQFQVDNNGNIAKINNVAYSFPAVQATSATQVLSNDGSGNLSWVSNGSTITQTTNSTYSGAGSLNVNTDNLVLNNSATYFRMTNASAGSINLTGLNSSGVVDGRVIVMANVGSQPIVLKNQDGGSTAANRFDLPGASDVLIAPKGAVTLVYDMAELRWKLVSTN